jgi:peptide chain release factor 1
MLLPKDPDDVRNTFLEIRAGTGGDESALFAGDLLRMYVRYAERQGWRIRDRQRKSRRSGRLQGSGDPHRGRRRLWQAQVRVGGHRVQRVPATETQGRIPHQRLHL